MKFIDVFKAADNYTSDIYSEFDLAESRGMSEEYEDISAAFVNGANWVCG